MTLPADPNSEPKDPDARAERLAMLRASASRYCAVATHVPRARRLRGTRPGFDRHVWRDLAQLGWTGIRVPERYGGAGLGSAETAVVCEAMGRALLPEPLSAAVMAAGAILHGDNAALKERLLPSICRGEQLPALAWREAGHACDVLRVQASVVHAAHGAQLAGRKRLVFGGAGADGFVVSARSPDGIELFWIDAEELKGRIACVGLADGRQAAELDLDGLVVARGNCIAGAGQAARVLAQVYDEGLMDCSAELIGVMSRTLEISLDYLGTRSQFGKLIGSYQALQHRAVDQHLALFTSRCTMQEVLESFDLPGIAPEARGASASRVKARCADSALRITREAVQFHGAMGFSDECDVGLYLKRAVTLAAWMGGADVHRRRFAALAPIEPSPVHCD